MSFHLFVLKFLDCGNITGPADGKVEYDSSVFNSVANFSCNTGYNLTGETTATCTNTSMWSASAPNCTIIGNDLDLKN